MWERIQEATRPDFRDRLLDKGLARNLIWIDGRLPAEAPRFSAELSEDLLDYGFSLLAMTLRARSTGEVPDLERAFRISGEAIEAAVHRNSVTTDSAFNRVCGAVAFHLAGYSARAYSMLPPPEELPNLSPMESVLVALLRRNLENLHDLYSSWLLDEENTDEAIAARIVDGDAIHADAEEGETNRTTDDEAVDEAVDDAIHRVITSAFMRSIALLDHTLTSGDSSSAERARDEMRLVVEAARDLKAVNHWWTSTLALHLIDELWNLSFHRRLPRELRPGQGSAAWEALRKGYIQRLRFHRRSAIEFWPSQLDAVDRSIDVSDDLVVALPTSAGKTRIAELCILAALAANTRVYYVTPLRALSAQVERDLADTFAPLGISVSSLYGAAGVHAGDTRILQQGKIVVATPEKIDFALRSNPHLLDDVGLVVLDEGHMLGKNEREVRYEALVQRLLRRSDASSRRLVCLSAMFPTPDEMRDLVAWIRQDEPGGPVFSEWRPTRQRFGVVRWTGSAARLEVKVAEEAPFVPRFVEGQAPPARSRRRTPFPKNKNELTLATAWQFIEQGKDVLIYSPLRVSVETLGELALKCIAQDVLVPFAAPTEAIQDAMAIGQEWLGGEHPAVRCLQYGIVLHHGGLPRAFLSALERLLKTGQCRLTIASPTLAQGLNLAASVLLVPSIWRNREIVPAPEFANVAGRAGRAFVDMEGLVLHMIWPSNDFDRRRNERLWQELVLEAKATRVRSGVLDLTLALAHALSRSIDVPLEELINYVSGRPSAWDYNEGLAGLGIDETAWDRDLASLDAAILGLLDANTPDQSVAQALDTVLQGSLFSRQLREKEERMQGILRGFIATRARGIWTETTDATRKGFAAAGIGLKAGRYIDLHISELVALLLQAESAISTDDPNLAASAIEQFAGLVLETAPFRPPRGVPEGWRSALGLWVRGMPSTQVIAACEEHGVDLLHEFLTYRLPWAMEAVRVHAVATAQPGTEDIQGLAALALEVGSTSRSAIFMLRHGLSSREAAIAAVESTGAEFTNRDGMLQWMQTPYVQSLQGDASWPTARSHRAWIEFRDHHDSNQTADWERVQQTAMAEWDTAVPPNGTNVLIEVIDESAWVFSLTYERLGKLLTPLTRSPRSIVQSIVNSSGIVDIEYFGPISPS